MLCDLASEGAKVCCFHMSFEAKFFIASYLGDDRLNNMVVNRDL
jgi:hypothetical protein